MLTEGHIIAHSKSEEEWLARIIKIEGNDLHVRISNIRDGQWEETWNLAYTEAGLNDKTYYIVGKCHD